MSLPLSFINIFGGNYGSLPLSWFNIFCIAFFFNGLTRYIRTRTNSIVIIVILFIFSIILSTLFSFDFLISVKSLLTTGLTCLVLIVFFHKYFPGKYSKEEILFFGSNLITVLCSTATVMLFFRILWFTGIEFEFSGIMNAGAGRMGNRFLFSDYSFLSVFLAMGAVYCFFFPFSRKWKKVFLPILLLLASVDTTARSGLAAILIFGLLFFIKKILQGSMKYLLLSIPISIVALVFVIQLNNKRNNQSFFEGSGRIEGLKNAVWVIKEKPIFGVGPGAEVYVNYLAKKHGIVENNSVPHNIFFQSLVYYGFVGFIILLLFFMYLFNNCKNTPESNMFYVCMFGSLFIPDIFVSRFFLIIVILMWISKDSDKLRLVKSNPIIA